MSVSVQVTGVSSFGALESEWRLLEAKATGLSFFQSWTWVGCLVEERYDDPVLLRAEQDGELVGLALFNRRDRRLHLGESGRSELDAAFVEHNAPLIAAGSAESDASTLRAMLAAAWRVPRTRGLVLSGTPAALPALAHGVPLRWQERAAPYILLDEVRASEFGFLGTVSAKTRYQLRRSLRHFQSLGAMELRAAATPAEALGWFATLVDRHQATWTARGKPGAFAGEFTRGFHRALIVRALERGELEMLRLTAGSFDVGYLYNLRLRGRIHAYQSGLRYDWSSPHAKPGLTCHQLAIEQALARGDAIYDFLGGGDRYKRSLANQEDVLVWSHLLPRHSPAGIAVRLRSFLTRTGPAD